MATSCDAQRSFPGLDPLESRQLGGVLTSVMLWCWAVRAAWEQRQETQKQAELSCAVLCLPVLELQHTAVLPRL